MMKPSSDLETRGLHHKLVTAEDDRPDDDRQRATRLTAAVVDMPFRLRGGAVYFGRGLLRLVVSVIFQKISVAIKGY